MKDWEVNKVNELYEQLDQLKRRNAILEEQVMDLEQQNKHLQVYVNNVDGGCDSSACEDVRADVAEIKRLLTPAKAKRVTRKTSKK